MSLESTWRDVVGFAVMAACMTALATVVFPTTRAVSRSWRVAVAIVTFGVVMVTNETHLLRTVHEDIFERIGGQIDETSTWLVALSGALLATFAGRALLRLVKSQE
jgi:hypothetical protein